MAISRGRELASQSKPDPNEVRKSIAALHKDSSHVPRCMNAGLREYDSGQAVIREISDLIQQLEQKLCQHQLVFTMPLGKSKELILGSLKLIYPDGETIDYLATSGIPDWQRLEDQWSRGKGPIPAGEEYEIPTQPYWLDTRGVEGLFYHITPDPLGSGDRIRSELGIHYDANVSGTSGCIGLITEEGWQGFCRRTAKISALGIKTLPLKVQY